MHICRTKITTTLLLGALIGLAPTASSAEDIFGRTGKYDATRSVHVRNRSLNYPYIRGEVPSFAEQRGLAGAATVEVRRNFVYIHDTDGALTIPFQSGNDLFDSFDFALREIYRVLPDEFVFVYLFTSFDPQVGAFFYQPEAQTTRGIGEQTFDQNGSSPREGFVFMNYYRSFEGTGGGAAFEQALARGVFNQEAGHRWASFITCGAGINGGGADILLGRDDGHWSYFMHSSASPMEGNAWRDNGNGTFTTTTDFRNWHYSALDQYLMGLVPPTSVQPFFVITNPNTQGETDLTGQAITRSSTPQIQLPVQISGTRTEITIDEIMAINGMRLPAAGTAPTTFRVVFAILAGRNSALNEPSRVLFEDKVDDFALGFHQGTNNLGTLNYLLNSTPKTPIGGPCADTSECDPLEANVCLVVPPVPIGTGLCTRPCSTPASCPTDWCCQPAQSGVNVCLPVGLCTVDPPTPDAGMPMPGDSGVAACACNTSSACEQGCACDPACTVTPPGPCLCDSTTVCDRDPANGGNCACDPECKGGGGLVGGSGRDDGCTHVSVTGESLGASLVLLLAGLALLGRRRR